MCAALARVCVQFNALREHYVAKPSPVPIQTLAGVNKLGVNVHKVA